MLLVGPTLTDVPHVSASARPTLKPTAARTPRARRTNVTPGSARRTSDATRDDSPARAKVTPNRDRDAPSEKSAPVRGNEKVAAKSPSESVSSTKSSADVGKSVADVAPARTADVRVIGAKAPNETPPSTAKSAAEKPLTDALTGDAADATRPMDAVAPSARREPASPIASTAARPVVVVLEGPAFDGGDVPRAAAALDRMKGAFTKCASVENALTKSEASIDLRFLVRAPGRAEGVDVDKARGVSADVVRCMTSVLARSYVGVPSDDPVGVAVTVRVRKD
jgi:hypothetical protein